MTKPDALPRHIAVVMDGNGRWASKRFLPRYAGHKVGVESVREMVLSCGELGVEVLTLFAFSSENWKRPRQEVGVLMELFLTALQKEVVKLHKNNVRLRIIGARDRFAPKIQEYIRAGEEQTQHNTGLTLVVAVNYGGRWDITQAAQALAAQVQRGELDPDAITPELFDTQLSLNGLPPPDLFIRTGGEQRLSNFLLWQLAYTELYFSDVLWPDFRRAELEQALQSYASRQRRFGRIGDQVDNNHA